VFIYAWSDRSEAHPDMETLPQQADHSKIKERVNLQGAGKKTSRGAVCPETFIPVILILLHNILVWDEEFKLANHSAESTAHPNAPLCSPQA
jgi:hypothetical protein